MARPFSRGSAFAVAAAVSFGLTIPVVKRAGIDAGPFATAALLYAGSALGAGLPVRRSDEPALARHHVARLITIALFGAFAAPACLAWGLVRTSALTGSLLMNFESILTVILAARLYREPMGRRMLLAVVAMTAGGALLALGPDNGAQSTALGALAIAGATLGWALDSTLQKPLADIDPRAVVFWKSVLGASLSSACALALGQAWPRAAHLIVLVVCGALGYGLSLRFYLAAQRSIGAGRTGSLFALAPFIGAAVAFALGDRGDLVTIAGAATLFAAGASLLATERHEHAHRHEAMEHEHAHVHDDGHHTHVHDPPVVGSHSHVHRHETLEHAHPHAADLHHAHRHDD